MGLGEWIITGAVFAGLLIPAGLIKLSLLWTEYRVNQTKEEMKKYDLSEEERQLLEVLIENYELQKGLNKSK